MVLMYLILSIHKKRTLSYSKKKREPWLSVVTLLGPLDEKVATSPKYGCTWTPENTLTNTINFR
jgi:hypothetical protein